MSSSSHRVFILSTIQQSEILNISSQIHYKYYNGCLTGGSVIPAALKTPDNKLARIIKPGRNMPAVKTPVQKFA